MLILTLLAFPLTFFTQVHAVDNVVDLGYATYQGQVKNGASEWLGMRYAKPPVDNLRFAAPQEPANITGLQQATSYGNYCEAVGDANPDAKHSEDCLFIDVYAPTNATATSKLPVFFFIQGGGFASNANKDLDGRGLVKASGNQIVVVTSNYRVGPYGFLAGKDVSSPNNGLKDQRLAMKWVQNHISKFGGDPAHVTLGGDSAGAASISLHLTANGGQDEKLFHAAAAESVSFATVLTVAETQYQYDNFTAKLGCSSTSTSDTLSCLRSKTTAQIQAVNKPFPYPGRSAAPLYSWNPVIDNSLIRDLTYNAFAKGSFIKVPLLVGADTNDGASFAPNCTQNITQSNDFLRNQFPYLTSSQITKLNDLYPVKSQSFPQCGPYYRQLADVYGEMRYMCPGLFISNVYANASVGNVYNYRYNVEDPDQVAAGLGVPHTVELNAVFGPDYNGQATAPASYKGSGVNKDITSIVQGYWISFIRNKEPNTFRLSGSAAWNAWKGTEQNQGQRLMFASPPKDTKMETVDQGVADQWERCQYLWSIGAQIRQ